MQLTFDLPDVIEPSELYDYPLTTPGAVYECMPELRSAGQEIFYVLSLNTKHGLVGKDPVTLGLIDASLVHAREVFYRAIKAMAAAIIIVHNHPSGDPEPSAEDIAVTRKMVSAGEILGIRVLDSVIIGSARKGHVENYYSMREKGLIDFD